jgi:cardiolipin synthase
MSITDPLPLAWLSLEWTIRVLMLVLVTSRRSAEEARTWLLFALFLPVPTFVLYLIIGRPKAPRWRRRRFAEARSLLVRASRQIALSRHCSRATVSENLAPAARLIEGLTQFPVLGGNAIRLLADYTAVIDQLVEDIEHASDHVHLTTYTFANDATGTRIMAALLQAAERGIDCRVLIDAVGSFTSASAVVRKLTAGGIEVARALPLSFLRPRAIRADIRNHRKIVVIDGRTGYIGSQNIVDETARWGLVNKELVIRLSGPAVLELQAVFAADWFLETGRVLDQIGLFPHDQAEGGSAAQLLASGPEYPLAGAGQLIVALVHGARRRIVLTTPYFIPDDALARALETAARRGVEAHLILSRRSDSWIVGLAQRSYYSDLLRAGVLIHLYRDGLLHAKHVSADDDIVLIGSLNLDMRSVHLNAEASLVCYDPAISAELGAEQRRNIGASDPLSLEAWENRSFRAKLAQNTARLLSPLL